MQIKNIFLSFTVIHTNQLHMPKTDVDHMSQSLFATFCLWKFPQAVTIRSFFGSRNNQWYGDPICTDLYSLLQRRGKMETTIQTFCARSQPQERVTDGSKLEQPTKSFSTVFKFSELNALQLVKIHKQSKEAHKAGYLVLVQEH